MSSFYQQHHDQRIEWLYLTYGLLFGAGASLAYNPSLTVLGLYFKVIIVIKILDGIIIMINILIINPSRTDLGPKSVLEVLSSLFFSPLVYVLCTHSH